MVYGVDKLARYDKDDLWIFTYETGKARFKDYEKFCNNGRFQKGNASFLNKQNMNRFLNELREEKKIVWGIDEKEGFKFKYVPQKRIDEVKKLIEDRQIAQGINNLPKEEREKILSKMLEKDQNAILTALGQNGAMFIPEIAKKTGFTELKIEKTIWGPMAHTDTVSVDENFQLPVKYRKYGLTVLGLYRALRVDMANFDVIVDKWGYRHPFVFGRLELFRKYELEEALKEFISKLWLQPHTAEKEEQTLKRIEDYLIAFILSGFTYKYHSKWFELIHEDKVFRERIKTCFNEYLDKFNGYISSFQYGIKTIDLLGGRKPDWEQIKWREQPLIGLEMFMQFSSIHWDDS